MKGYNYNDVLMKMLIVIFAVTWSGPTHAWSYLEHSFLTDRSCNEVLKLTERELSKDRTNPSLSAKYMALSLLCPNQWQTEYCSNGKNPTAYINSNIKKGQHGLTLGDYSGLADHVTQLL